MVEVQGNKKKQDMATKIQLRGDSLSAWNSADPVLDDREIALVSTKNNGEYDNLKIGNGGKKFSELPYLLGGEITHKYTFSNASQTDFPLSAKSGETIYVSLYQPEGNIAAYTVRVKLNNAIKGTIVSERLPDIERGTTYEFELSTDIDSVNIYVSGISVDTTAYIIVTKNKDIKLDILKNKYDAELLDIKNSIPSTDDFCVANIGKNLYNPAKAEDGKFIRNTGVVGDLATTKISDYINVDGKNVVCNTATVGGTYNAVYNESKEFIRTFVQPYVYQAGDYYIRYTFGINAQNIQIEYGDVPTDYVPYTDKQDAVDVALAQAAVLYEKKHDNCLYSNRINNYRYSYINGGMYLFIFPDYTLTAKKRTLKGKYKITANVITDAETLSNFRNQVNTKLGSGLFKIERELDFSNISEQYPYLLVTSGTYRYFTNIIVEPLNDIALQEVLKYRCDDETPTYHVNVLEVCKDFDSTTEGFGVTRFNNPVDAHNVVSNSNQFNRYIITVAKGDYTAEIQESFKGNDSESGAATIGIRLNNYEFFESFDSDDPEQTIFGWDGTYGFSGSVNWEEEDNRDKIRNRAIFQIPGADNFVCGIKGLHLKGKNLRYDIHPETAANGFNHTWNIENCILEFDGRPILGEQDIAIIGTGMGKGTIGNVIHCEFRGLSNSAIGGHDNPASSGQVGFVQGAKLNLIDCLFNNKKISMTSLYSDGDTPDAVLIKNCGKILSVDFGTTWKYCNINSEIGSE